MIWVGRVRLASVPLDTLATFGHATPSSTWQPIAAVWNRLRRSFKRRIGRSSSKLPAFAFQFLPGFPCRNEAAHAIRPADHNRPSRVVLEGQHLHDRTVTREAKGDRRFPELLPQIDDDLLARATTRSRIGGDSQ